MRSKRLLVLLAVLALVVLAACTNRPDPPPVAKRPIDPPLPVAKRTAAPLKLYQGKIPPGGAAELTIMAHMS